MDYHYCCCLKTSLLIIVRLYDVNVCENFSDDKCVDMFSQIDRDKTTAATYIITYNCNLLTVK